jgi:hypothetical protein
MIKVNLLKGKGANTKTQARANYTDDLEDLNFDEEVGSGGGGDPKVIVKFLMMLVFPALLYVYEWYNIGVLDETIRNLQSQKSILDGEVNKLKPEFDRLKSLKEANDELNRKIKIVKDLGRLRLREIKAIDHLQSITPEQVWLTNVEYKNTDFKVEGYATNREQLDLFLTGLQNRSYYRDVILARDVEEKAKRGTVKKFLINSRITETE